MKEDTTEERPTTDGEQTNEPSQETAVETLETDTTAVNGQHTVNEENSEGEKAEDSGVTQVEDVNEETGEGYRGEDSNITQVDDFNSKDAEDSNAEEVVDANKNETGNMTTKESNDINANGSEKLNGDVSNRAEEENNEEHGKVEKEPSIPIIDQAEYVDAPEAVDEMKSDVAELRPRERRLTAYERLSNDLSGDQKVLKEITLGKRIGFYRIRGELGSGNFSQVKMGIHALTKGKLTTIQNSMHLMNDDF